MCNAFSVIELVGGITQGRPFDKLRANPGLEYITALRYRSAPQVMGELRMQEGKCHS
jgi:hypothetical protein